MEIISPSNGAIYKTIKLSTADETLQVINKSQIAFELWKNTSLEYRIQLLYKFIEIIKSKEHEIAVDLANSIGRPLKYGLNEVKGLEERAKHMVEIAPESLKEINVHDDAGTKKTISREPLGIVFVIGAWNYPYLVTINSIIPALLAGNSVILKHAPQTFSCSEVYFNSFKEAGFPDGVFQYLHIDHAVSEILLHDKRIKHVQFTGSVKSGRNVNLLAASSLKGVGLELGGNDAAYVCDDADVNAAAENLVDGAMYNSGQSCCGIQRIYIHKKVFQQFIEKAVEVTKTYILGDPLNEKTTLGPVVCVESANIIRKDIQDAINKGAKGLIDESLFPESKAGSAFIAPQLLVDVNDSMNIITDEVFGPVAAIVAVSDDDEAIRRINASEFGLTASLWSRDLSRVDSIGNELDVGTVFMNRCDYLDPSLVWTGVKNSGKGHALSRFGFDGFVRKQRHMDIPTADSNTNIDNLIQDTVTQHSSNSEILSPEEILSQLLSDEQTQALLDVVQAHTRNSNDALGNPSLNTQPQIQSAEEEALTAAIHAAVAVAQGLTNDESDDFNNSFALQLYQAAIQGNENAPLFWNNAASALNTPPASSPNSPAVALPKNIKTESSAKKSKRKSIEPALESMTEESTKEETELLNLAIANANAKSENDPSKELTYICPTCERIFSRLYNLKSHIRSHQNYRPYKCSSCQASFTRNHDLNRHEKTHNNYKPFACRYCSKMFARKDALRRHEKMNVNGKKTHCVNRSEEEGNNSEDVHADAVLKVIESEISPVFQEIQQTQVDHMGQLQELKNQLESFTSIN